MHAGLLIYGSLEKISGGYLYDRKLVEYLQSQGDQVEVVSLAYRNYFRHLLDNLSQPLLRHLEKLPIDLLLQDELNHPSLFWLNRRLGGCVSYPIIAIVHHLRSSEIHPAWQKRFYRRIERLYLASVDGFIYNSETTHQAVTELLGPAARNLAPGVVAYPAGNRLNPQTSEQEIRQRVQQPGPLRLLFLGNLIARKGLHTLLEALQRVSGAGQAADWKLTVIGSLQVDPSYSRAMRQQAARNGLEGRVSFLGALDNNQLAQEMRASHLLVVPSSYEGFGIVYLEGMGFGLPAIASTGGAAGEIITNGQNGYLIEPDDVAGLAEKLLELARNRQLLLPMSLAAWKHFKSQPGWDKSMSQAHLFLQQVIKES